MTTNIILKNNEEIDKIRRSSILAANALQFAKKLLQPGITTEELDRQIHEYIVAKGGIPASLNYMGFPKATCISLNDVICHGIPDDTIITLGDIVKIDVATILDGYFGDNCATFMVGEVSSEAETLVKIAEKCMMAGIYTVKPGSHFGNIGKAVSQEAASNNFSVVYRFGGHGVGIHYHEPPTMIYTSKGGTGGNIRKNMIFTVEPMINQGVPDAVIDTKDHWTVRTADGKLSAQFEHTILVVDDGCEILTIPDNG